MHRSSMLLTVTALVALTASSPAAAQYQGPRGSATQTTVESILKKPKDDTWVVLRGFLVRQTSKDRYLFSDGTGEIAVQVKDGDDDDESGLPTQPIDDKTRVEITGEVDKDFRKPVEIDVDIVKIVAE